MERTGRKERIFGNLIPFSTETYSFHKKGKQDLKEKVHREKIAGYNVEKTNSSSTFHVLLMLEGSRRLAQGLESLKPQPEQEKVKGESIQWNIKTTSFKVLLGCSSNSENVSFSQLTN